MNIKLSINKLQEDMVIAEDIFNNDSKLLIGKYTILNENLIKNILNFSSKKEIYIKTSEKIINITPVIELESGLKI